MWIKCIILINILIGKNWHTIDEVKGSIMFAGIVELWNCGIVEMERGMVLLGL